jgi:hypothetical protein
MSLSFINRIVLLAVCESVKNRTILTIIWIGYVLKFYKPDCFDSCV